MEDRKFSELEKKTITQLVKYCSTSYTPYLLVNVYNDIFEYTTVAFINGQLKFYCDEIPNDAQFMLKVLRDVIEKTLLLKYLIDKRYLYLIEDKSVNKVSEDIDFHGKYEKKYSIVVDLPYDISAFLKKTKMSVLVTQDLISLVENNFESVADKQLVKVQSMLETLKIQCMQLAEQTQQTKSLISAAEEQTRQALLQTQETTKQSTQALKQTEEAQKQTAQALTQSKEAKKQTTEAQKQTKEAFQQTIEAQKQTRWSFAALILSLLVLGVSIWQRYDNKTYNEESLKISECQVDRQNESLIVVYDQVGIIRNAADSINETTHRILNKIPDPVARKSSRK